MKIPKSIFFEIPSCTNPQMEIPKPRGTAYDRGRRECDLLWAVSPANQVTDTDFMDRYINYVPKFCHISIRTRTDTNDAYESLQNLIEFRNSSWPIFFDAMEEVKTPRLEQD
jgi:hypothetical protein